MGTLPDLYYISLFRLVFSWGGSKSIIPPAHESRQLEIYDTFTVSNPVAMQIWFTETLELAEAVSKGYTMAGIEYGEAKTLMMDQGAMMTGGHGMVAAIMGEQAQLNMAIKSAEFGLCKQEKYLLFLLLLLLNCIG